MARTLQLERYLEKNNRRIVLTYPAEVEGDEEVADEHVIDSDTEVWILQQWEKTIKSFLRKAWGLARFLRALRRARMRIYLRYRVKESLAAFALSLPKAPMTRYSYLNKGPLSSGSSSRQAMFHVSAQSFSPQRTRARCD